MGTTSANGRRKRLTPGVAVAAAAGTAGMLASCGALAAWWAAPALLAPILLLSPAMMAAASWLAARRAMRAALRPAVEMAKKLAAHDLSGSDAVAEDAAARELIDALARCREGMAARDKAMWAHAAVAKLTGAGIARLAQGDLSARITVDLPAPYDAFRRDFNAAMARLQESADSLSLLRGATEDHAAALAEAAARLEKRARKLDARIEADLRIVEVLSRRDAGEALEIARDTLAGAGIAARRNVEAAAELARLGEALGALPSLAGLPEAQDADPARTMAA
jgi:methyl-accepting chemotaxis protein